MLQDRDDVHILSEGDEEIHACQLRRHWAKTTLNPDGFNPVEREHWHYYGQAFVVAEVERNRKGELTAYLQDLSRDCGSRGGWVILFDPDAPLDAVIDRLGPVPEDFADYLARRQQ